MGTNIEIVIPAGSLPKEMNPAWFADRVAGAVRGEEGNNVTVLFGEGGGDPAVTFEGQPAADDAQQALVTKAQDAVSTALKGSTGT